VLLGRGPALDARAITSSEASKRFRNCFGTGPELTARVKPCSETSQRLRGRCGVFDMVEGVSLLLRLRSHSGGPALDARVMNSSMHTGYLHIEVHLPDSSSVEKVFGIDGIVPAKITTGPIFPGPVRLRQESTGTSADQSRERQDSIVENTTLNPRKRRGTGGAVHFRGLADLALKKRARSCAQNVANCRVEPGAQ